MKRRTNLILVMSALAGVLLGTLSNWLYDLLRDRGLFPAQPTWKAVVVVTAAALPLVVLVLLPELLGRKRAQGAQEREPDLPPSTDDLSQVVRAEGGSTITGVTQVAGDYIAPPPVGAAALHQLPSTSTSMRKVLNS